MAAFMNIRKPKIYHPRRSGHHVHDYKRLFRFDENNVNWIVRNVLLDNNEVETRGGALSTKQQLEAFLRYAADPGFQLRSLLPEEYSTLLSFITKEIANCYAYQI